MSFEYLPPMKESSLPDEPRYVLRGRNQFWKFAVFVAFSAFFAVVIYLDRASHATVEPVLVALGISVMAYYWYLVPYFEVTPVGLRLVNVFSTREIHWEIFRNVDTRFGLVVASEADVCTDSASFSKPENSGGVQGSAGKSSGGGKFRKPRLYRDSVGAFPARAKYVQGERASLWDKAGVHELQVTVAEIPELVYGMRELHRKHTNPKDLYRGPTERSIIARKVQWNTVNIAICAACAAAVAGGIWLLVI